jgi:hypothetical protein
VVGFPTIEASRFRRRGIQNSNKTSSPDL